MAGFVFTQSSGVNDSLFGKSQAPIKAVINEKVEYWENKSLLKEIFHFDSSKNFAEKVTTETSLGNFADVGENGAYPSSSKQEGFGKTIEHHTWKNKFEVSQEMIEDNKLSKIKGNTNQFVRSFHRTRELFGAALLAGGTEAKVNFGGKAYDTTTADGKPLFAPNHPSITKGKYMQSNIFKGAMDQYVFDKMQEKMQDFADDDGNILAVSPNTIIIPNSAVMKRWVFEVTGSDLDPESNNNAMNFQCGLWNIMIWAALPKELGGKPYYMMADSDYLQDYMCLPWFERVKLTVTSDIDSNTDANVFKGRARFGAGFNDWRGIAVCGDGLANGTVIVP